MASQKMTSLSFSSPSFYSFSSFRQGKKQRSSFSLFCVISLFISFFLSSFSFSLSTGTAVVGAMASDLATSCSRLKEAGIIPDVIPTEDECAHLSVAVEIDFQGGTAKDGQEWTVGETRHVPSIKLSRPPSHGQVFYLFFTDPDAPQRSHPVASEWAHWVVATGGRTLDSSSKTFLEYNGPAPPAGTGLHRYVLLVYEGKAGEIQGIPSSAERKQWGGKKHAHSIAKENYLTLVGVEWFTVQRV
ncbi:phosphatidylethanolamine-binding protein [Cystoisospora suis]|uniref:Phosphatidylethanolamine-binding protein n=1 Tax=Cystoisospora suis TaxID=483139 RepID=A0A2C6L5Z4_9APIC|nr:phosphatidylethanolamine-binding protein [Cystoisospora suis]